MLQQYHTKLKGTLALTDSYLTEKALQKEKGLYKFIWVRSGSITVEIDHQEMMLTKDEVISLTHLQHLEFKSIDGEYLTLLFNSNFYCIYGNDHEVSCSGFLFNGSSHLIRFTLNEKERKELDTITEALENEFTVSDSLQEEMLRILLKRFIIQCTRIARHRMNITREKESGFEIVRQYYNLVDEHLPDEEASTGLCRYAAQISQDTIEHLFNLQTAITTPGNPRTGGSGSQTPFALQQQKCQRRLPIFWDLKTRLLSAVSSKI